MADSTISALNACAVLDGTETVPIAQATSTVRTTTQGIANLASATSAKINTVSNALSNLISIHNVLSNRVSANSAVGGGSVTSAEVNTASAAATSADGHANTASAAATSADAHANAASAALSLAVSALQTSIQTASAAATSADGHANTVSIAAAAAETHANAASAAATSVDTRVNTLSNTLSAVSALSVGVAANGLQSAVNALSNTISAVSAAVTSVDTRLNTTSNLVSQHTVSLAALSNTVSAVSAAVTSVDTRLNTVSNTVSQHTVSLAQLSNAVSLLNAVSAVSAAGTAIGLQSVINQLSNRISSLTGGGTTSDQVSAMMASVAGTYSCRAFSTLGSSNTSVKGLQSVINRLSNTFSNAFSAGSVISCVSVGGVAVGLQSVVNALSNAISVHVLPPNAVQARAPITRRVLSVDAAVIASAALANISGLSVSVKNGGIYQFNAFMLMTRGGAATVHGFGITFPAMTQLRASMETHVSVSQSILVAGTMHRTWFDGTGSGSILISVSASQGARLPVMLRSEGVMVPSADGVVQMQAKAAGGASVLSVHVGSYIEVRRIN